MDKWETISFYYLITLFGDNLAPLGSLYSHSTLNLTNVGGSGARGPEVGGKGGHNKGHGARPKIYLFPKNENFGRATRAFYYFPQLAVSPRVHLINSHNFSAVLRAQAMDCCHSWYKKEARWNFGDEFEVWGALLCDLVECEVPFSLSMLHLPFGRAGAPAQERPLAPFGPRLRGLRGCLDRPCAWTTQGGAESYKKKPMLVVNG